MYVEGSPVPKGTDLIHLSPNGHDLARTYQISLGAIGDPRATLDALLPIVQRRVPGDLTAPILESQRQARALAIDKLEQKAQSAYGAAPMAPIAAVHALLRGAPEDVVVVDEGVSSSYHIRNLHYWTRPGSMYSSKQIIGWGMPAAIGVSLATGAARSVLCICSDGGATFALQSLWTAAHENQPVVFAVLVNREYGILRKMTQASHPQSTRQRWQAFDLDRPEIDYVLAARSLGVAGKQVQHSGGDS